MLAQDTWKVDIDGGVKDEDTKDALEGAKIEIIKDGATAKTLYANDRGKFDCLLEQNILYTVRVSASGYVAKLITVNTKNVPSDLGMKQNFKVIMQVRLFKEVPNVDFSILEKPIGNIFFDNNEKNFNYDIVDFNLTKKLEELQKEYEKKKKDTAGVCSGNF